MSDRPESPAAEIRKSAGETTGALRGTGGGCPADSAPTFSAATFRVGDAVIVSYMGEERMGVILSITNAKGSSRRFYVLDLPGALGWPARTANRRR